MLLPLTSVVAVLVTAQAVMAADGRDGPGRWLSEEREVLVGEPVADAVAQDPLSRLVEHVRRRPVGVAPVLTLLPQFLTVLKEYEMVVFGAVMMLTMIFMPRGLVPTLEKALAAANRRAV